MFRKYHKYTDRIAAVIFIFVIPAIVSNNINYTNIIDKEYDGIEVSGTMLGVWGAMLGFMITAMSIIMTLGDGEFIRTIRGTSHFKTIMFIISLTCMILFAATAFGAYVVCFGFWSNFCIKVLMYFLIGTGIAIFISMGFIFYIVMSSNDE